MKTFKNLEEMAPYYNEGTNTYVFVENDKLLDVKFDFDLVCDANITAQNINARHINAWDINALRITKIPLLTTMLYLPKKRLNKQ